MRLLALGAAIAVATIVSVGANAADLDYPPPPVGQPQYGMASPPPVPPPQVIIVPGPNVPPQYPSVALHRQFHQGSGLYHPQTAHQFGAAVCAVVLGSRAAYRLNSTLISTTRPVSITRIHGRPAPRCTSLPMRFHLQSTIPVHTHERSTRDQLVHIRGNVIYLLG